MCYVVCCFSMLYETGDTVMKQRKTFIQKSQGPGHGKQDRRPITSFRSFHSSGQDFDVEGGHGGSSVQSLISGSKGTKYFVDSSHTHHISH